MFLVPGDVFEVEIETIGGLPSTVIEEPGRSAGLSPMKRSFNPALESAMTSFTRAASHDVGGIRVTTVADGVRRFPLPDGLVVNVDRPEVTAALQSSGLPPGQMEMYYNPVVVDTAGGRALIDTGFGEACGQADGATSGLLLQSLAVAGIDPGSIDVVVISHFHVDHVSGLIAADGSPAFPRARVLVPAPEWTFWMDDARMAAAQGRVADLFALNRRIFAKLGGRVSRFAWNDEVLPGLTAIGTPGHTPGHTSFLVRSGDQSLFVQSDVTNNPALFVVHPDWWIFLDMDGPEAAANRRLVYDRVASEQMAVQGFHFPFPSRGTIEKVGSGYRLVPLP